MLWYIAKHTHIFAELQRCATASAYVHKPHCGTATRRTRTKQHLHLKSMHEIEENP